MHNYGPIPQHEADSEFWKIVCDAWNVDERSALDTEFYKHCLECHGVGNHALWCSKRAGSRGVFDQQAAECPNCLRTQGHDRYCPFYGGQALDFE